MTFPQDNLSYAEWLISVKERIQLARIKVALAANSELLNFYWDLGKMISEKEGAWGSKLIERVAKDLQADFPEMKGLSERNIKYCRQFYRFYTTPIGQQPVAQLEAYSNADVFHHQIGKFTTQIPYDH